MNTITLTLEFTQENLEKLKRFFGDTPASIETAPAQSEPLLAKVPEEPKAEPPEYTLADIKEAALALSKAGRKSELAKIFEKHGGKSLSSFKDKPELYEAIMKDLVAANA